MGNWNDYLKQHQARVFGNEAEQETPPVEAEPSSESFGNGGLLGMFRKASAANQSYNLDAMTKEETYPEGFQGYASLFKPVARGVEAVGKVVGAPFAALGALTQAGPMGYPVLRTDKPDTSAAITAGVEAGGQAAREMITPVDVLSFGAGRVARVASLADSLMGVGDISRGVEEGDAAQVAMGIARSAGNSSR